MFSGDTVEKIITSIIVIIGWKVVSRGNDRRERRKEVRAAILECTAEIRAIEEKAHSYRLTSVAGGRPLELQLKTRLKALGRSIDRLKKFEKIDGTTEKLTDLRKMVTGGDFESNARQPCATDSQVLHEISEAALALIDALEAGFRARWR